MIISPEKAIEGGWIKGIANIELQLQPNAIDFTIDQAFEIKSNEFVLYLDDNNREEKQMRGIVELDTGDYSRTGNPVWTIEGGQMIDGLSHMYVEVPDDVVMMLFARSTMTRNGLFITSGLYDTGFKGHIGFILHNRHTRRAFIGPGVRVGQAMFITADSVGQYDGQWNHEVGSYFISSDRKSPAL